MISKVVLPSSTHGSENLSNNESSILPSTNSATSEAQVTKNDIQSSRKILSNIGSHFHGRILRYFKKRRIFRNSFASSFCEFFDFVDEIFGEIRNCLTTKEEFFEFPKMNRKQNPKRTKAKKNLLFLFSYEKKIETLDSRLPYSGMTEPKNYIPGFLLRVILPSHSARTDTAFSAASCSAFFFDEPLPVPRTISSRIADTT